MTAIIKICGLTNEIDAHLALRYGAHWLGFNFYKPSPRYIQPSEAKKIIDTLPKDAGTVGLFVNADIPVIQAVLGQCPLHMIQLHGDESAEQCRAVAKFGVPVMKALRLSRPEDIEPIKEYQTDYILLDAFRKELYGGTGHTFDWSWIRQTGGRKIFLAGGIRPDNIVEALAVGTYGIDLCSGVEKEPGIKDTGKMKELFANIRKYYEKES